MDWWIGGLVDCCIVGMFFFFNGSYTEDAGWCWGGVGADKTNPGSQSGSISSPATSDMKEASFTKSDF